MWSIRVREAGQWMHNPHRFMTHAEAWAYGKSLGVVFYVHSNGTHRPHTHFWVDGRLIEAGAAE